MIGGPQQGQLFLFLIVRVYLSLGSLLRLLWEENSLDVWQDSSLGDRHSSQQLVQLLVVADRQLEVSRDDPRLLVVPRSVAGQLEDLGGQVLHDGGHVDGGTGAHPLGIVTFPIETKFRQGE